MCPVIKRDSADEQQGMGEIETLRIMHERKEQLMEQKGQLLAKAIQHGRKEAERFCEHASYEDILLVSDIDISLDRDELKKERPYNLPEYACDLDGFPSAMWLDIQEAFINAVSLFVSDELEEI